jgi:hypothetical protein
LLGRSTVAVALPVAPAAAASAPPAALAVMARFTVPAMLLRRAWGWLFDEFVLGRYLVFGFGREFVGSVRHCQLIVGMRLVVLLFVRLAVLVIAAVTAATPTPPPPPPSRSGFALLG